MKTIALTAATVLLIAAPAALAKTSPATVKLCNADGNECFTTSDASVKAKKPVSLDSIRYYSKLKVYFGQNGIKFDLFTP